MKKDIPFIFYLYIHFKMFEKFKGSSTWKDLSRYLHEWRIPKKLRPLILREMELLNLIKVTKKRMVKLNKPKIDEFMINKYAFKLELF